MAKNRIDRHGFTALGGGPNLLQVRQKAVFEKFTEFKHATVMTGTVISATGDYEAKVTLPCTIISASSGARIGLSMPDRAGAPLPDGLMHRVFVDSVGTDMNAAASQVVLSGTYIVDLAAPIDLSNGNDLVIGQPGESFTLRWRKMASGSMPTRFSQYGYWSIMSSSI